MKIIIRTKFIALNAALKDFIAEKFNNLEKFSEIFGEKYFNNYSRKGKPRTEIWIEIEKTTKHHQKGPFFRTECQARLPGKSLRAEALSKDLRLSIVEAREEMERQLKQYKNKLKAKTEKGQRLIKTKLQLSS